MKYTKNILNLITDVEDPKTSSKVKLTRQNNFIVKFEI